MTKASKKRAATLADELTAEAKTATSRFAERAILQLFWTLASVILALLVAALIMLGAGYNPGLAYASLLRGAIVNFDQVLWYATPLIITGLAVALAFKCGLFNIGAEGQLYMGAIAAAVVGFGIALPVVVHPLTCLIVGAVCGGLFAFPLGLLKAYRGTHEVVTTMMMSSVAILFTGWLVAGPLKEPGEFQYNAQTPLLFPSAWLPGITGPFLSWGFFVAIICVIGVYVLLRYTALGYELRAVGLNPRAAETAGINPRKILTIGLTLSGALAGIAGAEEIIGYYHRFQANWSSGLGFDGITVAVLGNNSPLGCFGGALFFAFLRAGSLPMQISARVPLEMVGVIQGLVILFAAAPKVINWLAKRGISYADWLQKNPKNALPWFLMTAFAVVGAAIGFGLGAVTLASVGPTPLGLSVLVALVTMASVALMGFYGTAEKKQWGTINVLVLSAGWFIVGACNFIFQQGTLIIPLAVLGALGLVVSGLARYQSRRRREESKHSKAR